MPVTPKATQPAAGRPPRLLPPKPELALLPPACPDRMCSLRTPCVCHVCAMCVPRWESLGLYEHMSGHSDVGTSKVYKTPEAFI